MRDKAENTAVVEPIWFLFGLSGAGKSFVADTIAAHTGWPVYHADSDITDSMRQALEQARPFTDAMRDEYFALLPAHIQTHRQSAKPLIVTQGAYKQKHRNWLRTRVPGLRFVWVQAPPELIMQRLDKRGQGIGAASAAALFNDFEKPTDGSASLINDGDKAHILAQWDVVSHKLLRAESFPE